ncbi:MAG: TlpA disulfide reductase family protein [Spirochaetota bacterium]
MKRTRLHPIRYRTTSRAVTLALLLGLVATVAIAGGRQEETSASAPDEPAEASVPAAEAPMASAVDEQQRTPETLASLPAMGEATAEALSRMGMMPFEEKIPSEDFELALLGGGDSSLSDYEGKLVFLNFWATWCPPCREEMPAMQTLYDELRDEGFEILAVNVLEDEQTAAAFIEENGFTYPVLLDRSGRVMLRYGVRAYPTTYLIDREGFVIGVRPGYHDWATDEVISQMRVLLEDEG